MTGQITNKKIKQYIPEKFQGLPIIDSVLKNINFNNNFEVTSATGSGKSLMLALVEAQEYPDRQIYIRQPSRLATHSLYSAYKELFSEYVTSGVMTSRLKENTDLAQIIFVSDGMLSILLKRNPALTDIIIYNDEAHQLIPQTEIEIAMQKRIIDERQSKYGNDAKPLSRILTATIDPKQFQDYMNLDVYHTEGRTYPLRYKVINKELESSLTGFCHKMNNTNKNGLVFVPTRAMTEALTKKYEGIIHTEFIHAGEDPRKLEQVMNEHKINNHNFILFSTVAGATSITIDVDEVYISDEMVHSSIEKGIRKVGRKPCSTNLLIQMAGRAGRIQDGTVILNTSSKPTNIWKTIKPEPIELPLENQTPYDVQLLLADYGIMDIKKLKLLSNIKKDEVQYAKEDLIRKGLIAESDNSIALTSWGKQVKQLPMDTMLGMLLVKTPRKPIDLQPIMAAGLTLGYDNLWSVLEYDKINDCVYPLHEKFRDDTTEFISKAKIVQEAFKVRASGKGKIYDWCKYYHFKQKPLFNMLLSFNKIEESMHRKLREPLIKCEIDEYVKSIISTTAIKSLAFDRVNGFEFNEKYNSYSTFHMGYLTVFDSNALHSLNLSGGEEYRINAIGKLVEITTQNKYTMRILNCPTIIR